MTHNPLHDRPRLDHLVVLADTLAEGAAWCEATLGVAPGPGGEHPLMGTHNRLIGIASERFPLAYLEIIAINSEAECPRHPSMKRWFDIDDSLQQARLRAHGPQLLHWVARVPDIHGATAALAAQGIDRGDVITASRPTSAGLLQWKITVRPDGQRLFDGCLPTLIEWSAAHPASSMPLSGVRLRALTLRHPRAETLSVACQVIGLTDVEVLPRATPALEAVLSTPRGTVSVTSAWS